MTGPGATPTLALAERWFEAQAELLRRRESKSARLRDLAMAFVTTPRSERLETELVDIARRLANGTAGSDPTSWGVLSGLEHPRPVVPEDIRDKRDGIPVLEELSKWALRGDTEGAERALWRSVASVAPHVRASVVLGTGDAAALLEDLESAVLELLTFPPTPGVDQQLLRELLPHHRRPPVTDLAQLRRNTDGVWLSVTEHPDNGYGRWIDLHELVIAAVHRGHGLGSAVLQELCRFADTAGLSIGCTMAVVRPRSNDQVRALARFYARHGFTLGDTAPEAWPNHAHIRRQPHLR